MKYLIAVLLLTSSYTYAQRDYAYDPDPYATRPNGATGVGVKYTQTVVGTIVGIGSPVTKAQLVGIKCPIKQSEHSVVNAGTIVGGVVGGTVGHQFGKGKGKEAMTILGAAIGGYAGDEVVQEQDERKNRCNADFETMIVGWTFTVEYGDLQMQGFMKGRQPQIGDQATVILVSTLYAGE